MSGTETCNLNVSETETCNSAPSKTIAEELEGYGQQQKLIVVDRDGDRFYVECPSCHSTDLNTRRLLSCRSCHTHFQPYYEDGCDTFYVDTDSGTINGYGNEISIVELHKGAYFKKILHGRNNNQETLDELRKVYPDMKIIRLGRDLRDGKDCHGHSEYKRFALIPLD